MENRNSTLKPSNNLNESPIGKLSNREGISIYALGHKAAEQEEIAKGEEYNKTKGKNFYYLIRKNCIGETILSKEKRYFILQVLKECSEEELERATKECMENPTHSSYIEDEELEYVETDNNVSHPNLDDRTKQFLAEGINLAFLEVLGIQLCEVEDKTIYMKKYGLWLYRDGLGELKFLDTVYFASEQESIKSNFSDDFASRGELIPTCCKRMITIKFEKCLSETGQYIEFEIPLDTPAPIPGSLYTLKSTSLLKIKEPLRLLKKQPIEVSEWTKVGKSDYKIEVKYHLVNSDSEDGRNLKEDMQSIPNNNHDWLKIDCKQTDSASVNRVYLN